MKHSKGYVSGVNNDKRAR
ncbi:hypothetical protein [Intestinirhabdus alba]